MADLMSAGARRLRSAAYTHVDHRKPYHDHLCRCRACKPPFDRRHEVRRRVWIAALSLLAALVAALIYAALPL